MEFKNITGWNRPANQLVTIRVGQTTQASGTYTSTAVSKGTLEGFVTGVDAQGKLLGPISGTTVLLQGDEPRTTDAQGFYSFTGVSPGAYQVTASKTGYYPATKIISLAGGQTLTAVISLTKAQPGGQPIAVDFSSPNGKHFIPGMPGTISFEATVDWKGTPGSVLFLVAGEEYPATMTDLGGGLALAKVTIPAPAVISSNSELMLAVMNGEGLTTTQSKPVYFYELPQIIPAWYTDTINWSWTGGKLYYSESFSVKLWQLSYNEVYTSSASLASENTLSFDPEAGAFEGSLGSSGLFSHTLQFSGIENIGSGSLGLDATLKIVFDAPENPIQIIPGWRLSASGRAGIGYPVVRLVQVVFPPAAPVVDFLLAVPVVRDVLSMLRARFFLLGGMGVTGEYDGGFNLACYLAATSVQVSGTLGIELQVAFEKWGAKVAVYAGGSGSPEAQVCPDWDFLGVVLKAYVGFIVEAWLFE